MILFVANTAAETSNAFRWAGAGQPPKSPLPVGHLDYHLIMVSWAHKSLPLDGIAIDSAAFAQHIFVTNIQTGRPRYVRHLL